MPPTTLNSEEPHYTPSDRVYRDVTGVALPGLGSLDAGMCSASEETRVQACNR